MTKQMILSYIESRAKATRFVGFHPEFHPGFHNQDLSIGPILVDKQPELLYTNNETLSFLIIPVVPQAIPNRRFSQK